MRAINQRKHRGADKAAAPVEAGDVASAIGATMHRAKRSTAAAPMPSSPTYVRVPQLEPLRGLKRGSVYNLLKSGAIESVSVPCAGTRRGLRLVNLASVDRFLERLRQEQNPEPVTT